MIAARSPILRAAVATATPFALIVAAFVFFSGHNRPGGGFAAGLILGAVVAVRTIAGVQRRIPAVSMIGAGVALAAAVALAPLAGGETLLDQAVVERTLPVVGKVKSGSALLFDIGVVLVVVGLVAVALDALGPSARPSARPLEQERHR